MEKLATSLSNKPQLFNPLTAGALAQPTSEELLRNDPNNQPWSLNLQPNEELKEQVQQVSNIENLEQIQQEHVYNMSHGNRRRPNIFNQSRSNLPQNAGQIPQLNDEEILLIQAGVPDQQIDQIVENEPLPIPVNNIAEEADQQRGIPINLNENAIPEQDRDSETYSLFDKFKTGVLLALAGNNQLLNMSAKGWYTLFKEYRYFIKDARQKKELPKLREFLQNKTDEEVLDFMNTYDLYRKCRWRKTYDVNGKMQLKIQCFDGNTEDIYEIR